MIKIKAIFSAAVEKTEAGMKENITIVLPSFLTFLAFTITMYRFENYKLAMVGAFYIGICFVAAILNILG